MRSQRGTKTKKTRCRAGASAAGAGASRSLIFYTKVGAGEPPQSARRANVGLLRLMLSPREILEDYEAELPPVRKINQESRASNALDLRNLLAFLDDVA